MTDTGPGGGVSTLLRGWDVVNDAATGLLFIAGAIFMFAMVVTRLRFRLVGPVG